MKEIYNALIGLKAKLTDENYPSNTDVVEKIFKEYKSLLDKTSAVSEDYSRWLWGHYSELSDIEFDIEQSTKAKSKSQKNDRFHESIRHLIQDIGDLASLIKQQENFEDED